MLIFKRIQKNREGHQWLVFSYFETMLYPIGLLGHSRPFPLQMTKRSLDGQIITFVFDRVWADQLDSWCHSISEKWKSLKKDEETLRFSQKNFLHFFHFITYSDKSFSSVHCELWFKVGFPQLQKKNLFFFYWR